MILDGNRRWAKARALRDGRVRSSRRCGEVPRVPRLVRRSRDHGDDPVPAVDGQPHRPHAAASCTSSSRSSPTSPRTCRTSATGGCSTSVRSTGFPTNWSRCSPPRRRAPRTTPGLHINLAVGYGGRREIADAMRSIARELGNEGGTLDDLADRLTPELIASHLYTGGQPDPDLVIRTSGEQRLSDFMLWQSAHSEFYFVEALGTRTCAKWTSSARCATTRGASAGTGVDGHDDDRRIRRRLRRRSRLPGLRQSRSARPCGARRGAGAGRVAASGPVRQPGQPGRPGRTRAGTRCPI